MAISLLNSRKHKNLISRGLSDCFTAILSVKAEITGTSTAAPTAYSATTAAVTDITWSCKENFKVAV
jgi:hypothetical protein